MEFQRALRDFATGAVELQLPRLLFSRREAEGIVRLAPAEASMKALRLILRPIALRRRARN
jgi:hypothetical protein